MAIHRIPAQGDFNPKTALLSLKSAPFFHNRSIQSHRSHRVRSFVMVSTSNTEYIAHRIYGDGSVFYILPFKLNRTVPFS